MKYAMALILALFINFNVFANDSAGGNLITLLKEAIEKEEVSFLKRKFTGDQKTIFGNMRVRVRKDKIIAVIKIHF